MMKIYVFKGYKKPFILLMLLLCFASIASAQINLKEKNASLERVLTKIRQQSGYDFFFDRNDLKKASPVTVVLDNADIMDALSAVLEDQPFDYFIKDKTIILKYRKNAYIPSPRTTSNDDNLIEVSGSISGLDGGVLAGATLSIEGTQINYATDHEGKFIFEAKAGSTVWITFLGFEPKSFKVLQYDKEYNIRLQPSSKTIEEVSVNTGYQTLSKERVSGSFSKADMKVFSQRSASNDVLGRLEGLIPGLQIEQDFDIDYNTHTRTRRTLIRGAGSVNLSNQPLYVVDGVAIADFNLIDINDIEDITVLKDASSAAIWGARAANGVIVVKTKTGNRNEKVKFSYNTFTEFKGRPDLNYSAYMNSEQFIRTVRETFDATAYPYSSMFNTQIAPHQEILYDMEAGTLQRSRGNAMLDSLMQIDNKSQVRNLIYQNAITTNHNISASGGGKYYSFYSSLGYNNERGSFRGTNENTYRISLNQQYMPKDWIALTLNAQIASSYYKSPNQFSYSPRMMPYQLFADDQGNALNMPYLASYYTREERANYEAMSGVDLSTYKPLEEYNYVHSNDESLLANLFSEVSIKIWKGIGFKGNYGYTTSPRKMRYYEDHATYAQRDMSLGFIPVDGSDPYIPLTGGLLRRINANQSNWTVRNQLTYQFVSPLATHRVNIQIGQEANQSLNTGIETNLLGWDEQLQTAPYVDYKTLKNGVFNTVRGWGFLNIEPYRESELLSRFSSYFMLGSYMFADKYGIDVSWRRDHSNVFGSDISVQNKPVYSIGGRWNISKENFFKNSSLVSNLALRATYGVTGNSPYIGSATSYDIAAPETFLMYPQIGGHSYYISQPANRKLVWEATRTINLGVDFGLLNNRILGSVEFYNKNTSNLIGNVPNDLFTGLPSITANIGEMRNQGININLTSSNIVRPNFTWTSSLVLGYNKNKLETFSVPDSYENQPSYRTIANYVVDYPMEPIFAYRYAGLDENGDPMVFLKDGSKTKERDVVTLDDLVYMGTKTPIFSGGFGNVFSYKDVALSFNLIYNFGAVMRNEASTVFTGPIGANNLTVDFLQRWKQKGDEQFTDVPSYTTDINYEFTNRNTNYYFQGDRNVLSASYIKLRDVTLSYSLPQRITSLLRISSASFRVQMNNIMVWKNNKYGIDPDYYNYRSGARNFRIGANSFAFGVNLNF